MVVDQTHQHDQETIKVQLQVAAPKKRRSAQLASIAPSAISKIQTPTTSELLSPNLNSLQAQTFGLCVHAVFEHIHWTDSPILNDDELAIKLISNGFDHSIISKTIPHIRSALQSESIHKLHTHDHWKRSNPELDNAKLYHERPFAVRIGEGNDERFVQGRFDRLVLGFKQDKLVNAHIIDYKTDRKPAQPQGNDQPSASDQHSPQMELYRQAACTMFGLDPSMVRTTLVLTAQSLVIDIHN